jgi:hypothetical protein
LNALNNLNYYLRNKLRHSIRRESKRNRKRKEVPAAREQPWLLPTALTLTKGTTPKACAISVTISTAETKMPSIANTLSAKIMQKACA